MTSAKLNKNEEMETIVISTGVKRLRVLDDSSGEIRGVLEFNPEDVNFAKKFYKLVDDFKSELAKYQEQIAILEADSALDEDGVPKNAVDRTDLMVEICTYIRGEIDTLFSEGTSEMMFGSVLNIYVFPQFFEHLIPYIKTEREKATAKYIKKK